MKGVLFLTVTCLLSAPLSASATTLEEYAFSVRYRAAFLNDRMGVLSAGSFSIKPEGFTSLEFNVGVSSMKEERMLYAMAQQHLGDDADRIISRMRTIAH